MMISLYKAELKDASKIHEIQVKSFMPLLEKYKDYETSPANESVERIAERINQSFTDYYIIKSSEIAVGGIRIVKKENKLFRVSPIFVRDFELFPYSMDAINRLRSSYICPHASDAGCECHKPKPGLLIKAAQDHQLDLTRCAVIGDVGSTDMMAADAVGAIKVIVMTGYMTGWRKESLEVYRHKWSNVEPDFIAPDFLEAAKWLVSKMGKRFQKTFNPLHN
ncbi:HAD hydrolase-like protein [Cohnella luojiensis]|uniref:Uncharacterized protein n=1 Tax=Cohnella luojiensis TaxID=652876 RepID=A0A4Y8LVY2_9BACL|nr:HAD hydrolase-like protein [Cohnella luojiensis]TFE25198.1 hypothetical protein E2980_14185 [Cohnella luojiensis]